MLLQRSTSATREQGLPPPTGEKEESVEEGGSSGECGGGDGKYPEKHRFGILLGMLTIATMVDADGVVADNRAGSATTGLGRNRGDGVGRTGKSPTLPTYFYHSGEAYKRSDHPSAIPLLARSQRKRVLKVPTQRFPLVKGGVELIYRPTSGPNANKPSQDHRAGPPTQGSDETGAIHPVTQCWTSRSLVVSSSSSSIWRQHRRRCRE